MWQLVVTAVSQATLTDWLLFTSGLLLILYIVGTWNYDYFEKRGIPSSKPKIPFMGDMATTFLGFHSIFDQIQNQYKNTKEHGIYGFFEFRAPSLMIHDPELLKLVTVKEFDSFMNHRTLKTDKTEPILSKNLFNLEDQTWRDMRATLSPAFTTSKLKAMLPLISECGDQMVKYLRQTYETSEEELLDEDIAAQASIFFFAGFETVSTALCVTTHALSYHPEEQKHLFEEIIEVMEKSGGKLTYESVQGMKYLDAVVNEALRLYPPVMATDRLCQKDTQLPATATCGPVTICEGLAVNIPIVGLHYDSKYWENPEEFNPDRFSDENKHNIRPFTYMPFGLGPRVCIAQRFALIEVKIIVVHLLFNFELLPSAKTKHPLKFKSGFNVVPEGGFWCELKPRNI